MQLHPHAVYHLYNRGNNRNSLFLENRNYPYFIRKVRTYLMPYCDVLAYVLMPNHFHFLVHANDKTLIPAFPLSSEKDSSGSSRLTMSAFSHGMQMLLSSYAKAINHQYGRTGSLFTQNTRAKQTSSDLHLEDYSLWCFTYIHNNPVRAGLVSSPGDWAYSSYREYLGRAEEPICNIELARELLSLNVNQLSSYDKVEIPDYVRNKLY